MFSGVTAHQRVARLTTVRGGGMLLSLPSRQHISAWRITVRYLEDTGLGGMEPDADEAYRTRDDEANAEAAADDAAATD